VFRRLTGQVQVNFVLSLWLSIFPQLLRIGGGVGSAGNKGPGSQSLVFVSLLLDTH